MILALPVREALPEENLLRTFKNGDWAYSPGVDQASLR